MNRFHAHKALAAALIVATSFMAVVLWLFAIGNLIPPLQSTASLILVSSLLQLAAIVVLVGAGLLTLRVCRRRLLVAARMENRSTQVVLLAFALTLPIFVGGLLPAPYGFVFSFTLSALCVYVLLKSPERQASEELDRN